MWTGGRVRLLHEELPTTKDELEAAIIRKFVGALEERMGTRLQLIPRTEPNGWPDFEGTLEGRKIGIEIVEAIDPDHARKRSRQREYLRELLPRVADLEADLDGLHLTIVDGYQEPEWPSVRSKDGQRLLAELEASLRASVPRLQQVSGPAGCHLIWSRAPKPCTGLMVMRGRRLAGSPTSAVDLSFQGSFPLTASFLANTVLRKIEKDYTVYPGGDLWLLAYAEHALVTEADAVALARLVLGKSKHSFSAAWAFFPFPGQHGGILEALHP